MKSKKMLVVDDDEAILLCLAELSEMENWDVVFASNGEECLQREAKENFSLILLDHRMPIKTGEEVLAELCAKASTVPVVVMSAEKKTELFKRFPLVVDTIAKPFDLDVLVKTVNPYIR